MGISLDNTNFTSYFTSTTSNSNSAIPANLLPLLGTGHFDVGCADIMVDADNSDQPTYILEKRGFFGRLFYPTGLKLDGAESTIDATNPEVSKVVSFSAQSLPILQPDFPSWRPRDEYIDGLANYRAMNCQKMRFFFDWIIGERRIPAHWHKPITSTLSQKFPVIIFSHGISGNRLFYSTFCASMASYGYVVVALEHRDGSASWSYTLKRNSNSDEKVEKGVPIATFPVDEREFELRNGQMKFRAAECINALRFLEELNSSGRPSSIILGNDFNWSQLSGRLDTARVAFIGHSFGGATVIEAASKFTDSKNHIVCCIVLDGWLYPLEDELYSCLDLPILFLNANKWQWAKNVKRMLRLIANKDQSIMFTLKNVVHQSFSDFSYLSLGYLGKYLGLQGESDPYYAGEAIFELANEFLRGQFAIEEGARGLKTTHQRMRFVASRYADLVLEGTDIDMNKVEPEDEPRVLDDVGIRECALVSNKEDNSKIN